MTAMLTVSCSNLSRATKYPDMVADIDPFSIGTVNASFDPAFSTQLKTDAMEIIFYPRENEVALEFKHNLGQYRQLWNKEGRRTFIEALSRYEEDFRAQKLRNNYYRTSSEYGKSKNRFQWKSLSISTTYGSSPVIELGYRFRDNSPFFTTHQLAAKEETKTNANVDESPSFTIYYNRAQAQELARLFDEAFLISSVQGKEALAPETIRDEYQP